MFGTQLQTLWRSLCYEGPDLEFRIAVNRDRSLVARTRARLYLVNLAPAQMPRGKHRVVSGTVTTARAKHFMQVLAPGLPPEPAWSAPTTGPGLFQLTAHHDVEAVARLLQEGANANERGGPLRRTRLHAAAISADGDADGVAHRLVALLIAAGADVNALDDVSQAPLHLAALSGGPEAIVQALLDGGADRLAEDHDGNTPLSLAVGHPDLQALLEA